MASLRARDVACSFRSLSFVGAVVSYAASIACGGGASASDAGDGRPATQASPPYVSGQRLRANVLDGGLGGVLFVNWHDSHLNLDCSFGLAGDNVFRCLPSAGPVVYSDPACTKPVVIGDAGCAAPAYGRADATSVDACHPVGADLYTAGASIGIGATYRMGATGCVQAANLERFTMGQKVDPTQFVAEKTRVTEDRGSGLSASILIADDEARQIINLVDPARGSCVPRELGSLSPESPVMCLAGYGYEGKLSLRFKDTSCSTLVPAFYPGCSDKPPAAILTQTKLGACQFDYKLHLPGNRIDGAVYIKTGNGGNSCVADTENPSSGYELGPEAPSNEFPNLSVATLGTGPTSARYYGDLEQRPLLPQYLYDAASRLPCTLMASASNPGVLHCMPGNFTTIDAYPTAFTDAACTKPALLYGGGACAPPAPGYVVTATFTCDTYQVDKLQVLLEHPGPAYNPDTTGSCQAITLDPGTRVLALDPPLSLDTFPVVMKRTE